MHFSKRIALRGINKGLVINDNRDNLRGNQLPAPLKENNTTQRYTTLLSAKRYYAGIFDDNTKEGCRLAAFLSILGIRIIPNLGFDRFQGSKQFDHLG